MLRKLLVTMILFFTAAVVLCASEAPQERRYLVAYSASDGQGVPRYLMEIDQNGRIVRGPRKVTEPAGQGAATTGLFQVAGRNPLIWLRHRHSELYVLELDSRTWSVISRKKTSMKAFNTIDAGNGGASGLLTAATPNGRVLAYSITSRGISTGKPLDLSAGSGHPGFFAAISSDGRSALYASEGPDSGNPKKLILRSLNAGGRLTGGPRAVVSRNSEPFQNGTESLWPGDLTDLLSGNRRLIAYIETPASDFVNSVLLTRNVPSDTSQPLGSEIRIESAALNKGFGDVALDPDGRFVLFTTGKRMVFQRLNQDGSAKGSAVELLSGNEFLLQVDILRR